MAMQPILVVYCVQVCGQADVWGDGITPVMTAHLTGAVVQQMCNRAPPPSHALRHTFLTPFQHTIQQTI